MLLALVVGLHAADAGTVGALVVPLKNALDIDNTQVGLLVTVSTGVGALATVVAGPLADRVVRTRLLWMTLLVCSMAMALSALSPNYACLLASRVVLGAGVAVSGPLVASLMGDLFAPAERGRVYGLMLAGAGACTAVSLLISGQLGSESWRLGFWWLAGAGFLLAVAVATLLHEPRRGGQTCLAVDVGEATAPHTDAFGRPVVRSRSVWRDVRYVLSIRTNIVLVVGSSFGYFFMAGLSTFGVALLRGRFQIGQSEATFLVLALGVGALIGVVSTGRIADWLMTRGHLDARMTVGGAAFLVAAVFTLPTLLADSLALALTFAFLAAIGLGGINPPLNAARLDIVNARHWGTAEAVRTTLVSVSTGAAPLVFGLVSTRLGGAKSDRDPEVDQGETAGGMTPSDAAALELTFLIMLVFLVIAAALILCVARRSYARDVASAIALESSLSAALHDRRAEGPLATVPASSSAA